jgi:SAM-dependent methyltransferase
MYDTLYRFGAPWEGPAREELVHLVRSGRLTPDTHPPGRAIDLGCGSGSNTIFLADHGFDVTGVDFSPVALQKAKITATGKPGRRIRFLRADLTAPEIPDLPGPFDLLVDYGTLDDLKGASAKPWPKPSPDWPAPAPRSSCGASTAIRQRSPASASKASAAPGPA